MRRSEDGSVVIFVAVVAAGLMSLVAMASFAGRITLGAQSEAIRTANSAARAGVARALDESGYRAGVVELDPAKAMADAHAYLLATGHEGSVAVAGDTVTVTVLVVRRVPFFNSAYRAKGVGSARLAALGASA